MPFQPPGRPIPDPFALAGSLAATAARFGSGIVTQPREEQPDPLPELYEFEGCPFCRIVREVLTELDLNAVIRPCPQGGTRFRADVTAKGGRMQFPFLVDPGQQVAMNESGDIIRYLFMTYGDGHLPLRWRAISLQQFGSALAGAWRPLRGRNARPSREPELPLELYSFEGSPYARLVRERLCELELPWVLRTVGRSRVAGLLPPPLRDRLAVTPEPGTAGRQALFERAGRITVPWLVDPNTGLELGESAEIIEYLEHEYAS